MVNLHEKVELLKFLQKNINYHAQLPLGMSWGLRLFNSLWGIMAISLGGVLKYLLTDFSVPFYTCNSLIFGNFFWNIKIKILGIALKEIFSPIHPIQQNANEKKIFPHWVLNLDILIQSPPLYRWTTYYTSYRNATWIVDMNNKHISTFLFLAF